MDKKNKQILTDIQKKQKRREYMRNYYIKNKKKIYKYHKNKTYTKRIKKFEKPYFSVKRGEFIVTFD